MMKNIEQIYDDFVHILSDEELESLGERYGIVDKRILRICQVFCVNSPLCLRCMANGKP